MIGRLHVITDETVQDRYTHVELARMAAEGGADVVQFREKRPRTTRELVETAREIAGALSGTTTRLVVNDRVDVALAAGAGAVHLGRDDLDVAAARAILGSAACIGGTAHSPEEAVRLTRSAVDYLGVGPVFGTRSKANPAPVLGLDTLQAIAGSNSLPVIAIGNITVERVGDVLSTGAHGVAVLSAVVCSADPRAATRFLREAIDAVDRPSALEGASVEGR